MTNVTLLRCIMDAYGVYRFQVGAPAWMNSSRYDIIAKAAGTVPPDQLRPMLQTLLAERFHLTVHRERKNQKVYVLGRPRAGTSFAWQRSRAAKR